MNKSYEIDIERKRTENGAIVWVTVAADAVVAVVVIAVVVATQIYRSQATLK